MEKIVLYHAPGSCARVTMSALEEAGAEFEDVAMDFSKLEHKQPDYLARNPKGQVPALQVGENVLTENPAILSYINARFPDAGLFPADHETFGQYAWVSDLVWFSGALHPQVRQIMRPSYFTNGDEDGVRALGLIKVRQFLDQFEARFEASAWWYGDKWSIMDVYAFWLTTIAEFGGVDLSGFSAILRHRKAVRERPSFQRALAREHAAIERKSIVFRLPEGMTL